MRERLGGSRLSRGLLVVAGTLLVALGVVGVFVPLLPTTPFLLAAAACYARSSERMHRWLLSKRIFAFYLGGRAERRGLPLAAKLTTLALLWLAIGSSGLLVVPARLWWARLLLLAVALAVTAHILRIGARRA
ncbi:MAG: YbaN family protein [Candidatus Eisenbacteria bacterium]|uniref:YbaN family protein n=1 Tax=Eiseniibacteriota bacterium TaxID=2212470 RepID=A0A938BLE0_UNCEI|nr:YbaN family protein [Candidatus Eisenbacteria bacterium]